MEKYTILHEDAWIVVIDKLAPVPVQKERSGEESLQDALHAAMPEQRGHKGRKNGPQFPEAVHRLDRRASGLVLFAKTQTALSRLMEEFRDGRVEKLYVACVEREPLPHEGMLEGALLHDGRLNRSRILPLPAQSTGSENKAVEAGGDGTDPALISNAASGLPPGAKYCRLEYRLAGASEHYWFLNVRTKTGRPHQVRAQLAAAGWPIRGDLKYGAHRSCRNGLIMLHARSLAFAHPSGSGKVEFTAAFPGDETLWQAYGPSGEESPDGRTIEPGVSSHT